VLRRSSPSVPMTVDASLPRSTVESIQSAGFGPEGKFQKLGFGLNRLGENPNFKGSG
jgi:hypothetical protein